jgi:hypothetical protein
MLAPIRTGKENGADEAAPRVAGSGDHFFVLLLPLAPVLPDEPVVPLLPCEPPPGVLPVPELLPEPLMVLPLLPMPLEPCRLVEPLVPVEP